MPRKRVISPEFWEDETIGSLSLGARLLFVGTWNLADDEGLLRFNPPYLKSALFMYDNLVTVDDVARFMDELIVSGVVTAFTAGRTQQTYAQIKNFLKWQRIDKPQKSQLPKTTDPDAKVIHSKNHSENCSQNDSENTSHLREEKLIQEKLSEATLSNESVGGECQSDTTMPEAQPVTDMPPPIAAPESAAAVPVPEPLPVEPPPETPDETPPPFPADPDPPAKPLTEPTPPPTDAPPGPEKPKKQYGNAQVTLLIETLKSSMGLGSLDGTVDGNRRAAYRAIQKIASTAGSQQRATDLLAHAIRSAVADRWYAQNMTGMSFVAQHANNLVLKFPLPA